MEFRGREILISNDLNLELFGEGWGMLGRVGDGREWGMREDRLGEYHKSVSSGCSREDWLVYNRSLDVDGRQNPTLLPFLRGNTWKVTVVI